MESKTIIGVLLIILVIAGLLWWGRPAQESVSANPNSSPSVNALEALETLYDFGKISMAQGKVEKTFEISNADSQDIILERITTSCMCTAAYIVEGNSKIGPFGMPGMGFAPKANMLIKAGETRSIDVVYDPNAHGPAGIGPVDRFVSLTDTNGGNLELEIKAVVTP